MSQILDVFIHQLSGAGDVIRLQPQSWTQVIPRGRMRRLNGLTSQCHIAATFHMVMLSDHRHWNKPWKAVHASTPWFNLILLRPQTGSDILGQFGTFLLPLKCGVGNGKSTPVSKVPKTPYHYTNILCSCQGTQPSSSRLALGITAYETCKLFFLFWFSYCWPNPKHMWERVYCTIKETLIKVWWHLRLHR